MKANSTQREPEIQKFWDDNSIYKKLSQRPGDKFVLHDGPIYANGSPHVGHALNKILKDITIKYKILCGKNVEFIPGWDCHGLPIELKVLHSLSSEERKSLTPLQLRELAHNYALEQVTKQKQHFHRWGVWGNWETPYLTLNPTYEADQISVFTQLFNKGLIYRGSKPVYWSPSSSTALAEAELEYKDDHISPSVYVKFSVFSEDSSFPNLSLVIWTTTPWTIPANKAIAANPSLQYSVCYNDSFGYVIMATDCINSVSEKLNLKFEVVNTFDGNQLDGIQYTNPINNEVGRVVIGDNFITADTGTGLVHIAPGHGMDDYRIGCKYNLPNTCIVDSHGNLTTDAGRFAGLNVLKDANKKIIEALIEESSIMGQIQYQHKYPYDWRTKKPVIFRTTEQWFISIDKLKPNVLTAIESVDWQSQNNKNRMIKMVSERGDWCISRQRNWGVPIPVFYHKDTRTLLINNETLSHIQNLVRNNGSNVWWELSEKELLPPEFAHESDQWEKGTDTMDVWFDSGSSWFNVLEPDQADLYLEGGDQYRGWFQSSLLTCVGATNKTPYRSVVTHGFVLDDKGRKMSKSIGNVIDPCVLVKGGPNKKLNPAYGADVLRLWVSSVDYTSDVSIGNDILKQVAESYRKIRNTVRFLLGNLYDFDPEVDSVPMDQLPILERWILHKTSEFVQTNTQYFDSMEFYKFYQSVVNFCTSILSNFYFDVTKDCLYVNIPNNVQRRSTQTVFMVILETLTKCISPVLSHMAEDIWLNIPYKTNHLSVFQGEWPEVENFNITPDEIKVVEFIKDTLRPMVNKLLEQARTSNKIGSSLEAQVFLQCSPDHQLMNLANTYLLPQELSKFLLVSEVTLNVPTSNQPILSNLNENGLAVSLSLATGSKCDRCWHYEASLEDYVLGNFVNKICKRCQIQVQT